MNTKKKHHLIIGLFFVFITCLVFFLHFLQDKDRDSFLQIEQHYPEIAKALIKDVHYKIPNLEETLTIETKSKKVQIGKDMVPQGLTFSEDYGFISAYSEGKKYHSVIYVLDKKTGKHLKTIVLPDTPHLGGLAYDPVGKNLWMTTETTDDGAQLSALSIKQIEEDHFEKTKKAITYQHQIALNDLSKASFLAYYESNLVVGHFKKENEGTLVSYPLNDEGLPEQAKKNNPAETRGADSKKEKVEIIEKLQGVTFYQDQILFSQSYGQTASQLFFTKNNLEKDPTAYTEKDFTDVVEFPPYLEQIVAHDNRLYVLFESSALPYRHKLKTIPIDEVLVFDLTKLKKGAVR